MKYMNSVAEAINACVSSPGEIVFYLNNKGKKEPKITAFFAIKMHYETEAYSLFMENYFSLNRIISVDDISVSYENFKPCGTFVPSLNSIFGPTYLLSWEDTNNSLEKAGICLKNDLSSSANAINTLMYKRIIQRYITDEKAFEELKKKFLNIAQENSHTEVAYHNFARNLTENGFVYADFHSDMKTFLNPQYTFDEFINLLNPYETDKVDESLDAKIDTLFSVKETAEPIVRAVFKIKNEVDNLNTIFNNKNHMFHKFYKISHLIKDKATVTVSVPSVSGELVDFKFPVTAFSFRENILYHYHLTNKESERFVSTVFGEKRYGYYKLTQPLVLKYKNKVIYSDLEENNE